MYDTLEELDRRLYETDLHGLERDYRRRTLQKQVIVLKCLEYLSQDEYLGLTRIIHSFNDEDTSVAEAIIESKYATL